MQPPLVLLLRAAVLMSLARLAHGSPTVSFPFNSQVPPVAWISQPFSFIFAENTFTSSSSINYSLSDPPSWLSIDSDARWLHGTPKESEVLDGDVVGYSFGLVATDDSGSVSLNSTLVVSRNKAPAVNVSISQQLEESGNPYSEPSSLLYYPDSPVNFTFSPNTFSPSSGLNFYAVSGDNSPLPSWMAFDEDAIRFSGVTPSSDTLVEPPQTFNFQLIASDVNGFSAAAVSFSVIVGSHEITVDDPSVVLNASIGKTLKYDGLQTGVKIDGKQASSKNLTATARSVLPDWLVFDNSTWEISGTPPSSAQSTAFVVSFSDVLSDMVNVTVQVDIDQGEVFRSNLPNMQAQYGSDFSLGLKPYLLNSTGVEITVQTQPQEDWIVLDARNLTVTGNVPLSGAPSSVSVSVHAARNGSNTTESQTFMLQIVAGAVAASPKTTTSTTATAAASGTATAATATNRTSTKAILLAVLIPTMLLCFTLSFIAGCYCYRRRSRQWERANGAAAGGGLNEKTVVGVAISHDGRSSDGTTLTHTPEKAYKVTEIPAICIQPAREGAKNHSHPANVASATTRNSIMTVDRESKLTGADIPEFPTPPKHMTPPRTKAASSDAGTTGQWPFEESTLLSSASKASNHGELQHSDNDSDSAGVQGCRDILGISGETSTHNGGGAPVPPIEFSLQRVSAGTPVTQQESPVLPLGYGRSLFPEGKVESQEAIIDSGDKRGSMFVAAGSFNESRFSVQSIDDDEHVAGPAPSHRILGGLAAKITSRFRKPKPEGPPLGPSRGPPPGPPPQAPPPPPLPTIELIRSPVAPSEDSDYGSVTFGDVTMVQPFRPRPVFITSPNPSRIIAEEEEDLTPPRLLGGASVSGSRAVSQGSSAPAKSLVPPREPENIGSIQERRLLGLRKVSLSTGHNDLDDDNAEDEASDAAIRLDPPRPAFLGPVSPQYSDMDLSQEIARSISLRSRRPISASSDLSGISAAMEEVRSLLLLPYDTADPSRIGYSRMGYSDGLQSPSSGSWETLQSAEPNWTSVFDNVAAPVRQTLYGHDLSTPFAQSGLQLSHPGGDNRPFVFPDTAYNYPVEESIAPEVEMCDADAVLGAYPESQQEASSSDSYPEGFVEAHLQNYSHSPELRPRGIGLAVSKYSQPQMDSHNSLTSRASSGVLAFI
ncbi:transmembrane glycoprotein [Grosmannia clavigera kw1407]|uniref:Transmembrane glycoprotein n=1 Tax=Grosmannia clavigera (strain kw1407 / UAMH 11150) TaxID=655863 RepID=F0XCP9_GROCL|nr:transmembrane glycoprotein [Grosmannia clavigera kw1407]EFX04789.1 transmembrane glycoprotein [Grosmannia clavigera kw1407]